MEQLKPCPFCGGEAFVEIVCDIYPEGGNRLRFGIACRQCGAELRDRVNKIETIATWNTREERTCRIETRDVDGIEEDFCTACGNELACYYQPHYCPNCGAKVVE